MKILLDNRFLHDEGTDCLLSVDGTDFLAPNYGKNGTLTNSNILGCVTRLNCQSKMDGFVGLAGLGTRDSGMIWRFFECLS